LNEGGFPSLPLQAVDGRLAGRRITVGDQHPRACAGQSGAETKADIPVPAGDNGHAFLKREEV
jgi:hypothetical protein